MTTTRRRASGEVSTLLTKQLSFRVGEEGQAGSSCPWTVFAAAVARIAGEIPAGTDPTVSTRNGQVFVTWNEPAESADP